MSSIIRSIFQICLAGGLIGAQISQAAATSICESPRTRAAISSVLSRSTTPFTPAALRTAIGDARVVLVGETHHSMSGARYADVIEKFAQLRGPTSCVALEMVARADTARDMMRVYDELTDQFREQIQSKLEPEQAAERTAHIEAIFRNVKGFFEPMVAAAERAGIRSIPVDHPNHFYLGESFSIDERNQQMAVRILNALNKRGCSSVLFIVGRLHIVNAGVVKTTVPQWLHTKSITTTKINMLEVNIEKSRLKAFSCQMPKFRDPQFVRSKDVAVDEIELYPGIVDNIRLNDFEYTLFVPD